MASRTFGKKYSKMGGGGGWGMKQLCRLALIFDFGPVFLSYAHQESRALYGEPGSVRQLLHL